VEVDISGLLPSWKIDMQAHRMSPSTTDLLRPRGDVLPGMVRGDRCCRAAFAQRPGRLGRRPAKAGGRASYRAHPPAGRPPLRRLAASEDEIDADPFLGVKPPKLDVKVVQRLSDDELRLMLKACAGKALRDRRDEACLRLLAETGMRAGELLGLNVPDVDLGRGMAVIRRGKGGAGRYVPFGPVTGAVVDRYLRVRRHHPLAGTPALWLAETGGGERLGYHGLRVALLARAKVAASRASMCTSCGTLSRRAGWRPRAVRAG